MNRTECDQFIGRSRDICRGAALTFEKTNRFRTGKGLQPLTIEDFAAVADRTRQTTAGRQRPVEMARERVGTALKARIEKLAAIRSGTGCGCNNLAIQMDRWGCSGCETHREEIVRHLVGNADMLAEAIAAANVPGCGLIAKLAGTSAAVPVLRIGANWLLTRAIEDAREQASEAKEVTAKQMRRRRPASRQRRRPARTPPVVAPPEPLPFTGEPRLTLISHLWPRPGWERHLDYLRPIEAQFDRMIVGVAVDDTTDTVERVSDTLGPRWEVRAFRNNAKLREVVTYPHLMQEAATVEINDVTFCHHFKGSQDHTRDSEPIRWWTETMYETVMANPEGVIAAMVDGMALAGSFRRFGRMLDTLYQWHYSGTFYAVRNAKAFGGGVPPFTQRWWGTESWPGDHFAANHAACLFGDNCGDQYKLTEQPRQELIEWRAAR